MRIVPTLIGLCTLGALVTSAVFLRHNHVKGTGAVVRTTISVAAFHGIAVEGAMDVVVTRANERTVVVEAQANIAELITTDVKNGTWSIGTSKGYSTDKAFIVHIGVPEMDVVRIEGSGSVKSIGAFTADNANMAVGGSGNITMIYEAASINAAVGGSGSIRLSGTCGSMNADIEGSGNVKAAALKVKDLDADIAGSGNVEVDASGAVQVAIAGSGNVLLVRKPATIKQSITGSGSVRVGR